MQAIDRLNHPLKNENTATATENTVGDASKKIDTVATENINSTFAENLISRHEQAVNRIRKKGK